MEVDAVYSILYTKDKRVLLLQREEDTAFAGYWTLPGGKVDAGETTDEAIRREMTEEITISPEVQFWKMNLRPHFRKIEGQDVIVRQHFYFAMIDGLAGQVKLGEGQDLRFFTLDELKALPVAFGFDEVITDFFSVWRGGYQDWRDPNEAARWNAASFKTVPTRAEHLDILVSILADFIQPGKWIVDLGSGSGIVEEMIFQSISDARIVGVDMSPAMMALAAERLAPYQDRYQVVEHNLSQIDALQLPPHDYQAVISVQALHHLTPDEMQNTYRFIYMTLETGGLFLLVDRIKVNTPGLWDVYQSVWGRIDRLSGSAMRTEEGETFAEHERLVPERGDLPVSLDDHLRWLRETGFEAACLHVHANRALIAARKI